MINNQTTVKFTNVIKRTNTNAYLIDATNGWITWKFIQDKAKTFITVRQATMFIDRHNLTECEVVKRFIPINR